MTNNSLKYFKGKKILITGHTGFKGSWLCIMLNHIGAKIYGISLKPEKNSLFEKANISKILKRNVICDIRNKKKLKKHIINIKPDILIHLAAQSLVITGYKNPLMTYETNFIGTLNILENIKKVKSLKKVLIVTTDKVYDFSKSKKFNENDNLFGKDPYSASKVCVEQLVYSYKSSYFNNIKLPEIYVGRSGNVIGGGDIAKYRIVPDIIKSIKFNKVLNVRNPNSIRPWQHVLDPLYGYLVLISAKNLKKNNYAWNFGPKEKNFNKVSDIIKKFRTKFNFKFKFTNKKFHETKALKLNSLKAKKFLNWQPKWNFKQTIEKIIEFEMLLKKKLNYYEVCNKQVRDYLN